MHVPADAALDRIVQHMTELFHTRGAAITFLPAGRQWSAASLWAPEDPERCRTPSAARPC